MQQQDQPIQECVIALEEQSISGNVTDIISMVDKDHHGYSYYHQPKVLQEHLKQCKISKKISNLLDILQEPDINPRTVLIEGAPGIGKTYLLKHVAFEWANNKMLIDSQFVFLLCLRDPVVQAMSSINDLVQYFYKQDRLYSNYIETLHTYLSDNGKSITFLIDGYDELPEKLQKDSFVASIITHQILPASGVVLTSRPHATAHLHDKVAYLITIMGFAEEDRRDYIKQSLKCKPDEMLDYLDNHPTIDNLCYIPFNLTVLMFLYKRGYALPKNITDLYEYFICLTIKRYLNKHQIKQRFKSLDEHDLPDPYGKIIHQLAALSYTALGKQQITFTLEEIRTACPDIDTIPEGINGLGLLQVVQHFGFIEETTTVNFLHLSLQEYLAAYHIVHLPPEQELLVLHDGYFDDKYRNTYLFYLGLTKGQRAAFKHFLSGGGRNFDATLSISNNLISSNKTKIVVSSVFLHSLKKILPLFRCFYEVDDKRWCDAIVNCDYFYEQLRPKFNASNHYYTNVQVEDMGVLLAFRQEWFVAEFLAVTVSKVFLKTLHQALILHSTLHTPIINTIILWSINPRLEVSQAHYIVEMVISCRTKVLDVGCNHLHSSEWIIQMLSHKSCMIEQLDISFNFITSIEVCKLLSYIKNNNSVRLRSLDLSHTFIDDTIANEVAGCAMLEKVCLFGADILSKYQLTSLTAIKLFSSININKCSKLKYVDIRGDFTDDQVAYEIANCFQHNCILTHLDVSIIKVSDEACLHMINVLEYNTTLQYLRLELKWSECQVNKIKSTTPIISEKRHLLNKCLPKLSCNDFNHKSTSSISIIINT